jgi:hypothetical protein
MSLLTNVENVVTVLGAFTPSAKVSVRWFPVEVGVRKTKVLRILWHEKWQMYAMNEESPNCGMEFCE